MAFRLRSSKFRHVYGSPVKKEQCYEFVKISKNAHDGNFCAVNPKFLAYVTESAGGGSFVVLAIEKVGRVDFNANRVCGHSGPVLDIKWSYFNDHIIASCSDDSTIKVWQIPEDGLEENLTEWQVDLHGHQRRVGYIEWHPTAENILLSASYDHQCILWNTETAEPINIINVHEETIFSIAWNREGSLFATTSKDKKIRIIEPREGIVVSEGKFHLGPKASKAVFIGNNRVLTTGFTRMSERQFALWDVKNMSKPLKAETLDSSSGVLFPYYDHDTRVVFLAGKGDGNIRYYEMVENHPYTHYLSQYQSGHPQRGIGIMPKRGIDPLKCEIVRFYKLHTVKSLIEPISMIVPRKSEMFQEDIFPPTASSTPSLSADEWISGQNREPILISLKDGQIMAVPKTKASKAVQLKDGALTHAPSITTFKAVGSKWSSTNSAEVKGQTDHSRRVKKVPIEQLPASVRNIAKLSHNEENDQINGVESSGLAGLHTKRVTKNATITNSHQQAALRVDRKVWTPNVGAGDPRMTNGTSPGTDKEHQMATEEQAIDTKEELAIDTNESPDSGPASDNASSEAPLSPDIEQPYKRSRQDDYEDIQDKIQMDFEKASESLEADISLNDENSEKINCDSEVKIGQVIDLSANVIGAEPESDEDMNVEEQATSPVQQTIQRFNSANDLTAISPFVTSPRQWRESPLYGSTSDVSIAKTPVDVSDGQAHEAPAELMHTEVKGDGDEIPTVKPSAVRRSNSWRNLSRPTVKKRDDDPMLERLRTNSSESELPPDNIQAQSSVLFENVPMETSDTCLIRPSKLRESLRKKKRDSPYISTSSDSLASPDRNGANSAKHTPNFSVTPENVVDAVDAKINTNGDIKLSQDKPSQKSNSLDVSPVIKGTPTSSEQNGQKSRLRKLCPDSMLSSSLPSPLKMNQSQAKPQSTEQDLTLHIQKVWKTSEPAEADVAPEMEKLVPQTDKDLRKAYFRQLEEISSLKEQIVMKDKRIRHLEMELRILKSVKGEENGEESNC